MVGYKAPQTIPPAYLRIKHNAIDVLNIAKIKQHYYREHPSDSKYREYCSAVITAFLELRNKMYIVENSKSYKGKFKKLYKLREYYFDLDAATQAEPQLFAEYLELLQDLAEDTGLTKVSVEDDNPAEAWKENL